MASHEWNEAANAAVFKDDDGNIVLIALMRPSDALLAAWVAEYPDLPIQAGLDAYFPSE